MPVQHSYYTQQLHESMKLKSDASVPLVSKTHATNHYANTSTAQLLWMTFLGKAYKGQTYHSTVLPYKLLCGAYWLHSGPHDAKLCKYS